MILISLRGYQLPEITKKLNITVADLEEGLPPPPVILGKRGRNDWRENGRQGK